MPLDFGLLSMTELRTRPGEFSTALPTAARRLSSSAAAGEKLALCR
jgi:hypothetical protein